MTEAIQTNEGDLQRKRIKVKRRNAVSDVAEQRQGLATEIIDLCKQRALNQLALGERLQKLRDTFPVLGKGRFASRPGWEECVEQRFPFTIQWARTAIRVYERFNAETRVSALPSRVTRMLAGPKIPDAAVAEVLAKIESDKVVSEKDAKEIVAKHRQHRPPRPRPHAKRHTDHAEEQIEELAEENADAQADSDPVASLDNARSAYLEFWRSMSKEQKKAEILKLINDGGLSLYEDFPEMFRMEQPRRTGRRQRKHYRD
jgi:hypothetical protein